MKSILKRSLSTLAFALLISPVFAAPHADLHWFIDDFYGSTVDGNVLKGGSKNLRPVSYFQYSGPENYTFEIFRYRYWFTDESVTSFPLQAFDPDGSSNWYRSNTAWTLPATDGYYYFYDKEGSRYADYSPYVTGSSTAAAVTVSQIKFNIGAEAKKGVAKIDAQAGVDVTTTTVKVTVDPTAELMVVFPTLPSHTEGGPLDITAPGFDWSLAAQNYSTPPTGWSFQLATQNLTDSDFLPITLDPNVQRTADVDLTVSTDHVDLYQEVPFLILTKLELPTGDLSYGTSQVVAYMAVPEPALWGSIFAGCLATCLLRPRINPH